MGRASVRAQIASYFAPVNVVGVSTTYRSRPNRIPPQAFNLGAGAGSGAVLVVHLPSDNETRVTLGPANAAMKFDIHDIAMEVLFQSNKLDSLAAQDDHDALLDAIMARFRLDRTLGSTNQVPIWQAGEGPFGIKTTFSEPKLGKQNYLVNGVIRFQAYEVVVG